MQDLKLLGIKKKKLLFIFQIRTFIQHIADRSNYTIFLLYLFNPASCLSVNRSLPGKKRPTCHLDAPQACSRWKCKSAGCLQGIMGCAPEQISFLDGIICGNDHFNVSV